jgi:uncharacterized lipoprotein YddW (UPF0748 family)
MNSRQNYLNLLCLFAVLLVFQGCKTVQAPPRQPAKGIGSAPATQTAAPPKTVTPAPPREFYRQLPISIPQSPREMRAVWIATVANIDWPTSSTASFTVQKEEFTKLLDYYKSLNFNTVIVQIRTSGDAFYPSKYAPWSRYLTGKEGQKPNTSEDPLSWMILEAHNRGLEFHAWLNPYRATMNLDTKILSPDHDFFKHKDWMIKYDTKYYYDPGRPEVRAHLTEVIREVVKNYNIDAIHFDDYFYPYQVPKVKFEDQASFKKYGKSGQKVDDWRRENVNILIRDISQMIKQEKPWVQFGISPFGVWRNKDKDPKGSNTRAGQTNYDELYADVLLWMKNGWIDYLIPQLYWSMDYNLASHRILVDWWNENHYNTHIYVGNGPYKIRDNADKAWENPMEVPNQLAYSKRASNIQGNAFFSAKSMYVKNRDVAELIKRNHYTKPILTPAPLGHQSTSTSLPTRILLVPHGDGFAFEFPEMIGPDIRFALIQTAANLADIQGHTDLAEWRKIHIDMTNRKTIPVLGSVHSKYVSLSFIDRFGKESKPMVFELNPVIP